jgi:superfamily II helicase
VAEEREGRLKEAKIGDNNEELAIARLEVSSEVVDALVNRGITQLFPIQVLSFLLCRVT